MSGSELFVGAVPAGGAWVAAAFDRRGFEEGVVADGVGDLWYRYEEQVDALLVGVPVGLVEEADAERAPDRLARAALGEHADRVATPPVREATRRRRYPAADRVHERKTGAPLSEAAFALAPAVAAVDELLQELPEARGVVRAAHPELCFRAFAGEPMAEPRGTAGGYAERMRTLAEFDPDAPPAVQHATEATAGHEVAVADVIDAVALAYTARPGPGTRRSLPPDPPTDPTGLPMEWVYRADAPLAE